MRTQNTLKTATLIMLLFICSTGCNKLVEVSAPYTSTNAENIYLNDATAAAVLTGIYAQINNVGFSLNANVQSISFFCGLSADELALFSGSTNLPHIACYKNQLSALTTVEMWSDIYPSIFNINAAIEGLTSSTSLTPSIKQQLLGEAKFMRAFFYFNLVNLYGDVPLVLSTDYTKSVSQKRNSSNDVYLQIVNDLKDAQLLLGNIYLDGNAYSVSTERLRPNKWVATALLAKVYLFTKDWTHAQEQASLLIGNSSLFGLGSLNNAFLRAGSGNKEAIWQLQPVKSGYNTQDAITFIIPSTGLSAVNPVYLTNNLVNSFESGDNRKNSWVSSINLSGSTFYYPYKYKIATLNSPVNEYTMVFRLAEQYLIRAEAEANNNDLSSAVSDLNSIRVRAGLPSYNGILDKTSILSSIFHERQVELFTEWGNRWFDLKRTGRIDSVMNIASAVKGTTWNTNQQLYPILQNQLKLNSALIQNPGY